MARKTGSHSEITGPKVRQAALKLIARHGFAAVSMRQIAAEVGVQAGALYSYIADKQTLLFDLMHDHMQALLAERAKRPVADTPLKQLEDFTRFHLQFHLPRADLVFISYMELRNLTPENFAIIEEMRKSYETDLETILRALKTPEPKITALALIAMLTGVSTWYRDTGPLSLAQVEDIYWDLTRKAVGA